MSTETVHGSCVAIDGRAVLLVGASGSGKSATSLDLISRGGRLVADDQVILTRNSDTIMATCLPGFEGKIEARGIGILDVAHVKEAELVLLVDLDRTDLHRLPPSRKQEILGIDLDVIYGRENLHLCAGISALLRGTRVA